MRFRYYVVDSENGNVYGTDDSEKADSAASCDGMFVINARSGEWVQFDGESVDICEE